MNSESGAISPAARVALMFVSVVILAGIVWFGLVRLNAPKSFEFQGNVVGAEEDAILISGKFALPNPGEFSENIVEVRALVSSSTRIVRSSFKLPSAEELAAVGGVFEPEKLPRENRDVDLGQLRLDAEKVGIGIRVLSVRNIFNKSSFSISQAVYVLPEFADR